MAWLVRIVEADMINMVIERYGYATNASDVPGPDSELSDYILPTSNSA